MTPPTLDLATPAPTATRPSAPAEAPWAFQATQWSLVLEAGRGTPHSAEALEKLCRAYWPPVHAYMRRQGHSVHEAQDLTQEFFHQLLAGSTLAGVAPHKGRFRSWIIGALKHFLVREWRRSAALKRGGGLAPLSLDALEPAQRQACEPRERDTPETVYERRWAETMVARVNARLRREFELAGQARRFDFLKVYLLRTSDTLSYAETAAALGLSEAAVRSAIHKLRQRFGVLIRREVASTVATEHEVEDELRHLLRALQL